MASGFKLFVHRIIIALLLVAVGILYIRYSGLSWVGGIIGCFYLYFALVLILDVFKEFPIVKIIGEAARFPLDVIYKLMQREAAKRFLTATMVMVLYLFFLLLVLLLALIPIILYSRWLTAFLYVSLVFGSYFITTPFFEKLFNRMRVEPMAEYSAQLGKFLIHLMYFALLVSGTIINLSKCDSIFWESCMNDVILPAFVTYLAIEGVINSRKSIKGI